MSTTGTCSRRTNSSASWLAIRPAPTIPTLVTSRANDLSGAPAGRFARFCTRSKEYRLAISSGVRDIASRASSSAAKPSSRVAVRAAAISSTAFCAAGLAPPVLLQRHLLAAGDGGVPRLATVDLGPVHGDPAGEDACGPQQGLLQEVGAGEVGVREAEVVRRLAGQRPPLVERVLDDQVTALSAPTRFGTR